MFLTELQLIRGDEERSAKKGPFPDSLGEPVCAQENGEHLRLIARPAKGTFKTAVGMEARAELFANEERIGSLFYELGPEREPQGML